MIFDTHSHLFDEAFNEDRKECFERLEKINGKAMIVGFSSENNQIAYDLAQEYNMYSSAGLHPSEASGDIEQMLKELEEFIKSHKVYAIGECGLDYHWEPYDKEKQKQLFVGQILLAEKYDLPLIIHSRDAAKDTFDIINSYKGRVKGVMHCYSGSLEMALEYVKIGWYISLGGPLTFKNSKETKKVCENIDINRLLIETDCPYLCPEPFRGKRNESSYVEYVAKTMASIKNKSYEEICDITYQNAKRLFKIGD